MIPSFNASDVLPPFVGADPTVRAQMSPYKTSMLELVKRFATSPERIAILDGLIGYRAALRAIGVVGGFQWIDGSFVENVESSRGRAPADVDIVTFAPRLHIDQTAHQQWVRQNISLFDPKQTKASYKCDAFYVDLGKSSQLLVDDTRYWFGLFSHQRNTSLWKGMLQVEMLSDDVDAKAHMVSLQSVVKGSGNA